MKAPDAMTSSAEEIVATEMKGRLYDLMGQLCRDIRFSTPGLSDEILEDLEQIANMEPTGATYRWRKHTDE